MRIASSTLLLSSTHELTQRTEKKESLRLWRGDRAPVAPADSTSFISAPPSQISLPSHKSAASAQPTSGTKSSGNDSEDDNLDVSTLILKRLLEKMFGGRFRMLSLHSPNSSTESPAPPVSSSDVAPSRQAWGMDYTADQTAIETEQMQFAAAGMIKTADGKDIAFSLSLQMQRTNVQAEHLEIHAGDVPTDPLVLDFDGSAAQLSSGTFQFDLLADGQTENLPLLARGSAFLALDRNRDGQINNGSELFGPATGQGFSELAQYDSDQNGWIDENDPVFADLRLWQPGSDGAGNLASLQEKNVGAISVDSVATPFTFKDSAGQTQATTSATGLFLQEDGAAGTVQELNNLA